MDVILINHNAVGLGLLFKTYVYLIEAVLPFIQNDSTRMAFRQNIEECKQPIAELLNGCMNLNLVNEFFSGATDRLNDSFNKCQCKNQNPSA